MNKKNKGAQVSTKPVYSGSTVQPGSLKSFSPVVQSSEQKKPGFKQWLKRQGKKLKHGIFGKEAEMQLLKNLAPEQEDALFRLLQSGQSDIENPYQGFDPIKQDALRTFYSDIVPRIYEHFTASGNNAISSPILQQNLSSAGAELASRLGALQSHYGMQNKQFGLNKAQVGLRNPYGEAIYNPGYQGLLPAALGAFLPGVGAGIGKKAIQKFF
jgi:hypothetical protein